MKMSFSNDVWFAIGIGTGSLIVGLAWVHSDVKPNEHMIAWVTEKQLVWAHRELTRSLNLEGKPVPVIPMPKPDRFPSRFPLAGVSEIGSGFGWRPHPVTGAPNLHEGLDEACG